MRNDVVFLDVFTGLPEISNRHVAAARHRSSQDFGITTLQFAARRHDNRDAALLHSRGRNFRTRVAGSELCDPQAAPDDRHHRRYPSKRDEQANLHILTYFFASFLSGSAKATRAPTGIPETATSSGLRASTWISAGV